MTDNTMPPGRDQPLIDPKLSMLRIYFLFSDALRWSFEGPLVEQTKKVLDEPPPGLTIREFLAGSFLKRPETNEEIIITLTYVSYWYAALYVVIEGWKDLSLRDPTIDALLAATHTDTLRRFR